LIKVLLHPLTCRCQDCQAMFPGDRFEPTWTLPAPPGRPTRKVKGALPLGHPQAGPAFSLWVTDDDRLATDWPGFPGTRGAKVDIDWHHHQGPTITGTRDPALAALAAPIPLRRKAVERINARCMVDYGLAPSDTADFITCDLHGQAGIGALACRCAAHSPTPIAVVVLYGVDGDYPDVMCEPCLERYLASDISTIETICSLCQQQNLYRHRIVSTTWYGAPPT